MYIVITSTVTLLPGWCKKKGFTHYIDTWIQLVSALMVPFDLEYIVKII